MLFEVGQAMLVVGVGVSVDVDVVGVVVDVLREMERMIVEVGAVAGGLVEAVGMALVVGEMVFWMIEVASTLLEMAEDDSAIAWVLVVAGDEGSMLVSMVVVGKDTDSVVLSAEGMLVVSVLLALAGYSLLVAGSTVVEEVVSRSWTAANVTPQFVVLLFLSKALKYEQVEESLSKAVPTHVGLAAHMRKQSSTVADVLFDKRSSKVPE